MPNDAQEKHRLQWRVNAPSKQPKAKVCKGRKMRAAAKVRACVWQEDRKWRDMNAAADEQKNRKWRDIRTAATSKTETKQKKAPQKEPWDNTGKSKLKSKAMQKSKQ
eukprot:6928208-Ditylum_brightwellii.AAC.1